jgi:hypothetical protein
LSSELDLSAAVTVPSLFLPEKPESSRLRYHSEPVEKDIRPLEAGLNTVSVWTPT